MKSTEILARHHRSVEAIFAKLEKSQDGSGRELVSELADALAAHMAIEHELFYPTVRNADESLISASLEEHAIAELELKRLLRTEANDPAFHARVVALKDLIAHHVQEEEGQLFPKAEEFLGEERSADLGAELEQRFEALMTKGHDALLPKSPSRTAADASALRKGRARAHAESHRRAAPHR